MIDSINEHDIIIIKYASVIGHIFDVNTLFNIIPFKGMLINDLYDTLKSFERRSMIEFLYDLDAKYKKVVCKFACPFLKETLYQRMLIEQRSEIHMQIARIYEKRKIYYLTTKKQEKKYLRRQIECGQQSIIKGMEETNNNYDEDESKISKQSLQILLVCEITDKLKEIKNYGYNEVDEDPEDKTKIEGIDKLSLALKYGIIEKKSDGKITWEKRFFALTAKKVQYYYHLEEYRQDKVPLGIFDLKDISEIKQISDASYGNKKFVFMVTVSKWIKKEIPKPKRTYIFSVENMEELYEWLISLNFLRFNAYYETFMISFGKVGFPLYNSGMQKKKKFIFDLEGKTQIIQYKHRRDNKHKTVKVILKNKNEIDINAVVYEKYVIIKKLINLGFLNMIGIIQQGITKNKETEENNNQLFFKTLNKVDNNLVVDEIKIPQHISIFGNVRKSTLKRVKNRDPNSLASQIASKAKRTGSLTLIKEDDDNGEDEEEEEEEDDESSSKESEMLRAKKKENDKNKKTEEKSIDKASENDKNEDQKENQKEDKVIENKNSKELEDNKDNSNNDDNKDNEDIKDKKDIKKKMMINLYLKLMKKLILMMRIIQVRKNRE